MYLISATPFLIAQNDEINLNIDAFDSIIIILTLGILCMIPISSLLNKSEIIPDWQDEKKKKHDELIRRLTCQARREMFKPSWRQRDVYDKSFNDENTKLTDDLIDELHSRPTALTYYILKGHYPYQMLYPIPGKKVGLHKSPVKAIDYLALDKVKWY